jgi:hypothetical protein
MSAVLRNPKRLTADQLRTIARAEAAADEARAERAGDLRRRNLEAATRAGIWGTRAYFGMVSRALEVGDQS